MNLIPLIVSIAEIAVAIIILYYIVPLLPMPDYIHKVTQALIILIAILVVLSMFVASPGGQTRLAIPPGTPSIIAPQR